MRFSTGLALGLGCASTALAQTFTSCNPTNSTCPDDKGLNSATFSTDFTTAKSLPQGWKAEAGTTMTFGSNGAEFTMQKAGQAPTIETDFYFFFGTAEITLKAAPGPGVISSVVLESDDLDEIDFEFFGSGTYMPQVETNFFGKGNTTSYDRATYHDVTPIPQDAFHTYKIDWNKDRIIFSVDGGVVRTLEYTDPLTNGGTNYPQTPMRLKLGNWPGGLPGDAYKGTREWAGGLTTYDAAPYVFYVKNVSVTNANPASSYSYSDRSGSYGSIKMAGGSGSLNVDGGFPTGTSTASAAPATSNKHPASGMTSSVATAAAGYPTADSKFKDGSSTTAAAAAGAGASAAATGKAGDVGSTTSSSSNKTTTTHPPQQQVSSEASLNSGAMASISIFTLAMCFWML